MRTTILLVGLVLAFIAFKDYAHREPGAVPEVARQIANWLFYLLACFGLVHVFISRWRRFGGEAEATSKRPEAPMPPNRFIRKPRTRKRNRPRWKDK